ncbi:MAG TPA: hypothetical protein VK210_05550 [Terriglobia bacterium]|nr:hypothetical protein [Terriglobia bacterium]
MRGWLILPGLALTLWTASAAPLRPDYGDSIVLAPLYIEYTTVSAQKFAAEASELRQRIGEAPHVLLGFSSFLALDFDKTPVLSRPIDETILASTNAGVDTMVQRAKANGLVTHVGLVSGFFHGWNRLRESAIQEDVRNAQWFADGWICPPEDLKSPSQIPQSIWLTPSRRALPLRARMEETVRIVSRHLADSMSRNPETLVSISGDGEVELTWERNFGTNVAGHRTNEEALYTDYSPFAVVEFRDSLRYPAYAGDLTPNTDDDRNGHTFNRDYGQQFRTWDLKYFANSGPISFTNYLKLPDKLPKSGAFLIEGGFDAPRAAKTGSKFWNAWLQFRRQLVANYVLDFANWVMTTPGKQTAFKIPAARFYSHQIPADFLFEQPDNLRLITSASPVQSAIIGKTGSAGVTVYNLFDGKRHLRTATPALFEKIASQSGNWGILEYNPSVPSGPEVDPSKDTSYYREQLQLIHKYRPHVIVPFPWSELPDHIHSAIKNKPFEQALREFVRDYGANPWTPWAAAR